MSRVNDTHDRTARVGGQETAQEIARGRGALALPILPEQFWRARPVHAHIRQAAHARLVSADLVLHAVLAKLAGMRSHELWFDSGRGRSSLNYFAAAVGRSGTGKSTGAAVVDDELLPAPAYLEGLDDNGAERFHDGLPLGSGEGIAEAFIGTRDVEVDTKPNGHPVLKKTRGIVRHNVFIVVDEGESFTRLGERTGATVATTLRSAWVGATLGQANGREDTTRIVKAHTYALGMLVGFQPSTALPLLNDTATGTAQRFAWASAIDRTLPDEPVAHPGQLQVPLTEGQFRHTARTGPIEFPDDIKTELRVEHIAKVRGQLVVDERDSQAPLMRCKMAALLAILDGRDKVTDDDWHLAAVLWHTSCAVRDAVTDHGQREHAQQAEILAQARVNLAERTAVAADQVGAKVERLAQVLAERVTAAGGLTQGAARKDMAGRDRHLFPAVADRAEVLGLIRRTPEGGLLPPLVGP